MSLFEHFPYTNFHSLNIEWAIEKIKELLQQGETLYGQLQEWKTDTDTELAEWKTTTLAAITTWEQSLTTSLEQWKEGVDIDFAAYEETLNQIKTDAEGYMVRSETAAETAEKSAAAFFGIPVGYARLKYLESHIANNAGPMINTGITLNNNSRVVVRYALSDYISLSSALYVFGARQNSSNRSFVYALHPDYSYKPYVGYGTVSGVITAAPAGDLLFHVLDFNRNVVTLDGNVIVTRGEEEFTTPSTCRIFGAYGTSSSANYYGNFKISEMYIYQDGENVTQHYVPVKRISDNALGLYDLADTNPATAFHENYLSNAGYFTGEEMSLNDIYEELNRINMDTTAQELRADVADLSDTVGSLSTDVTGAVDKVDYVAKQTVTPRDYVVDEAYRLAQKVRNLQTPNTFTMLAVSDMHWKDGNTTIAAALEDMTAGCQEIKKQVHLDYLLCAGDIIWRLAADRNYALGVVEANQSTRLLGNIFWDIPQFRLVGNHDINLDGSEYFTHNQRYSYFGIFSDYIANPSFNNRSYGYYDDDRKKIRFVCLNTTETGTNYGIQQSQLNWLAGILDMSDKPTPSDWKIIIMSHVTLDDANHPSTADPFRQHMQILKAYINGTAGSYQIEQAGSTYTISYDYTNGKNAAALLFYINGHNHNYNVSCMFDEESVALPLLHLFLPNALPDRDNPSINGITYTKTAGTATSTAFEVLVVNTSSSVINACHYGAGVDMVIHYGKTAVSPSATLTTSITSPTWNSKDTSVATVASGVVTAISSGCTTIWAYSETDNVVEAWLVESTI